MHAGLRHIGYCPGSAELNSEFKGTERDPAGGYDPCVVRTEAPSERSDNSGEGVGRLPRRQDDEHGNDGLHGLVVYSL